MIESLWKEVVMLKIEYRTLKYIKKHGVVSDEELISKFPEIDRYMYRIKNMIIRQPALEVFSKSELNRLGISEESYVSQLDILGYEEIENHKHKWYSFILPYGLTTIIAILSLIAQLTN